VTSGDRDVSLRPILTTLVCAVLAAPLGGCLVAAVGAAGAGGGYELTAERSFSDTAKDAGIGAVVAKSWRDYNLKMAEDIGCTVYEGRVLITGEVPSEDWRAEAVKRTWQVDGVKEVYDEIQVGPEEGFSQDMGDTTITTKLSTQIKLDADVKSINYTITTVRGVVYVIGSARSQQELDRVVDHARNIADVRRVVSYVRIRSGEAPKPEEAANPPPGPPPQGALPPQPPGANTPVSSPTPRQQIEVTPLQ
jgi:osmotically-inducible protein OsmY